jgi:hypothetical protein
MNAKVRQFLYLCNGTLDHKSRVYRHEFIKITPNSGACYVGDFADFQFGFPDYFYSYEDYERECIITEKDSSVKRDMQYPIQRANIEDTREHFEEFADLRSEHEDLTLKDLEAIGGQIEHDLGARCCKWRFDKLCVIHSEPCGRQANFLANEEASLFHKALR